MFIHCEFQEKNGARLWQNCCAILRELHQIK